MLETQERVRSLDDPLCARVVDCVRALGHGNLPAGKEVTVDAIARTDHPVSAWLGATVGWGTSVETRYGYVDVANATHCGGSSLNRMFEETVGVEAQSAGTLERAIAAIGDPLEALLTFTSTLRLSSSAPRLYTQEGCVTCRESGKVDCPSCSDGTVTCYGCCGDGKTSCSGCGGTGRQRENFWDSSRQCYDFRHVTCNQCWGSRRGGVCFGCGGRGWVTCSTCAGNAVVVCSSCTGAGGFTHLHTAYIKVSPSRQHRLRDNAPGRLKEALEKHATADLHPTILDLAFAERNVKDGTIWYRFTGAIPLVEAEFIAPNVCFTVTGYGKPVLIHEMPPWLDHVLKPLHERIVGEGKAPYDVLKAAQEADVPRRLLKMVGGTAPADVDGLVAEYKGALTEAFTQRLRLGIERGYHGLSRGATMGLWLAAVPVLAGLMAALVLVDVQGFLFDLVELDPMIWDDGPQRALWEIAWPVLAIVALYLVARDIGRKRLAAVVENGARKAPSQGAWPFLVTVPLLALYVVTLSFAHNGLGQPRQPGDTPGAVLTRMAAEWDARREGRTVFTNRMAFSQRKEALRAARTAEQARASIAPQAPGHDGTAAQKTVSDGQTRLLQEDLRALGVYAGAVDGVSGAKTLDASERVLGAVDPRDRQRFGPAIQSIVKAVRDDKIKLRLPDAEQVLVGREWRNTTRLRLTEDDRFRIVAALASAAKVLPETATVAWNVGAHRGTIATLGMADDPKDKGRSCFFFRHEIVTETGTDPGPARTIACKEGAALVFGQR
ncbi:peptidoglycan-binding domain-containing protein [Azospirillum soli]|uniref:peptidoglycan-binding domain-containing protein n=1 Tax=Azospirillum soli TaxID=1304799 RepID=UPI001AE72AF8|nr:hypothetical protein [Azospirillum soli]MBP2315551.1 hypothetical protein [Azospirillum soli]